MNRESMGRRESTTEESSSASSKGSERGKRARTATPTPATTTSSTTTTTTTTTSESATVSAPSSAGSAMRSTVSPSNSNTTLNASGARIAALRPRQKPMSPIPAPAEDAPPTVMLAYGSEDGDGSSSSRSSSSSSTTPSVASLDLSKSGVHPSGLREPKGIFQKGFRKWTAFIAHHPYTVAGVSLFLMIALSAIAFLVIPFDQGGGNGAGNFLAIGEKWVEEALVYQAMLRSGQDANFTTRSDTLERLSLSYRMMDDDKSIFTPEGLREFKATEDRILAVEGFDDFCQLVGGACLPPLSPTSIFFNATTGALLYDTQAEIDGFIESLKTPDGKAFDPSVSFFFPAVTLNGTDQGPGTRALYFFGGPLEGYASVNDRVEEQREQLLDLMTAVEDEILLMNDAAEETAPADDAYRMEVLYLGTVITNNELVRIINNDFLLASVAGVMVYAFLCLFSWSIFLSTLGLFHIVMSFPTAYFFYTIVAQFRITPSLNYLSLFIILGIGADDVFVYLDAWKQSGKEGPGITADLATRVHWTYRRAVGAMFVTSFTTFVAFLGTAFTPLPALGAFGWMAALVILTNFIWVCTWFPALVVIWDKYLAHRCCCRPVETNRLAKTTTGGMSEISNYRAIERFYHTHVTDWIHTLRWFIFVFFFCLMVAAVVGATYLEEPDGAPDDLPGDAQLAVASRFNIETFPASAESNVNALKMIWGRLPEYVLIDDRGEKVDRLSQERTGTTLVDEDINVATAAAQQFVLDMCDWVESRTCTGCPEDQIDNTNLVLPVGHECVMRAFKSWVVNVDNGTFPVPESAFVSKVESFYDYNQNDDTDRINWRSLNAIGIETGGDGDKRAVHVYISFSTSIPWTSSNADARDWYEVWDDIIRNDDLRGFETPEEMQWGIQTLGLDSQVSYAWVETFSELERSVYQTLFVSIGLAFLILNLTTLNLFISIIAIVAISTIVAVIVSTMVVIGWTLSYVEALSTMMLVGLAVDYTVHFANSYNEAGDDPDLSAAENRHRRVRIALTEMGISVLGGSATTLSSAVVLLFAVMPFFSQFGTFIFITIITAFIVSHTYFQAMLLIFGPTGHWGSWPHMLSCGRTSQATDLSSSADLREAHVSV